MKRALTSLWAMVLIASFAVAQPKIEIVGGKTFAFGNVFKGKKVDHKIIVKNVGTEVLPARPVKW
jgi:hypothetical protein